MLGRSPAEAALWRVAGMLLRTRFRAATGEAVNPRLERALLLAGIFYMLGVWAWIVLPLFNNVRAW